MNKEVATKTVFQRIIDRELPSEIVYEDEELICIKDKFPLAPVHLLLITKKATPSIYDLEEEEYPVLLKIFRVAKKLAQQFGIEKNYRIVTNRGQEAGQTVFHLHFHLLGGKRLGSKLE